MTFNVDLENHIIANVLQDKVNINTAARDALKAHPDLVSAWLDGVTTVSGANGAEAVNRALAGQ
jgi:glycine betaine/proline transport system substrate-binding protein